MSGTARGGSVEKPQPRRRRHVNRVSKMHSVADGIEHCEAVLVVSTDDAIYLFQVPFHFGGRTARICEIWLRLILSPSAILVSRDGEAFEIKTMSEVWKIMRGDPHIAIEIPRSQEPLSCFDEMVSYACR